MATLLLVLPLACAVQSGPWFEDVSEAWGALHQDGGGSFAMLMGSGAGWIDFDGDGDEDLVLLHAGGSNRLLSNEGDHFVDVSAAAGLAIDGPRDPFGVIAGDADQDGLPDLYVTTTAQNALFLNRGDGSFADVAPAAGCAGAVWSTSAAWADLDRDGDLDLYVGNYIAETSFPYHVGEPNHLFVNDGASPPRFTEMARELGIANTGVFGPSNPAFPEFVSPEGEPTAGCTLSVATLDYDDDGRQDVQVGNDFGEWVLPNALYRNVGERGRLAFRDVSAATSFDESPHYDMGIDPVDFDRDGDWDVYMTSLGPNVFLRNDGGRFVDATEELGPVEGIDGQGLFLVGWGTAWVDADNDGFEDLLLANGHIPAAPFLDNALLQPNALWRNVAGRRFVRVPDAESGMADTGAGRALLPSDVDGDGLVDFYVTNNRDGATTPPTDASRLFQNLGAGAAGHSWLQVRLEGRLSNREGIGARLEAEVAGARLVRQLRADPVYLSSPTKVLHFGLGAAARADRLSIRWPSGVDQELVLVEGARLLDVLEPIAELESATAGPTPGAPGGPAGAAWRVTAAVESHAPAVLPAQLSARWLDASGAPVAGAAESVALPPGPSTAEIDVVAPPPGAAFLHVRLDASGATDELLRPLGT